MRSLLIFLLVAAVSPAPAAFAQTPDRQVVTGMILKNDKAAFDSKGFLAALKSEWKTAADSVSEKDGTLVFISGTAVVMLANMDYGVPATDLAAPAGISWLWKTAKTEALRNQSHLVLSVIGPSGQAAKLYKLFTRVAACALQHANASGVFMNNQYLLLPKGYYLESARNMTDASLPLYLWVYFGILQENGRSSGYTYGLSEFGLEEMEIVDSQQSVQEAHAFLYDAAHDCVLYSRRVAEGDKVVGSEGQIVIAHRSAAKFVEGMTVKLDF